MSVNYDLERLARLFIHVCRYDVYGERTGALDHQRRRRILSHSLPPAATAALVRAIERASESISDYCIARAESDEERDGVRRRIQSLCDPKPLSMLMKIQVCYGHE